MSKKGNGRVRRNVQQKRARVHAGIRRAETASAAPAGDMTVLLRKASDRLFAAHDRIAKLNDIAAGLELMSDHRDAPICVHRTAGALSEVAERLYSALDADLAFVKSALGKVAGRFPQPTSPEIEAERQAARETLTKAPDRLSAESAA